MDGGEDDAVGLGVAARSGAVDIGQEGELREEFVGRGELPGVTGEGTQILPAVFEIGELRLHVILVKGLHDGLDGAIRRDGLPFRRDFVKGGGQLLPDFGGPHRRLGHAENLAEGRGRFDPGPDHRPQGVGRFLPHPGQQTDHAAEGGFVGRIDRELQKGGDIFDVRLLEEAQPAGHFEGNAAAGQLELNFHRMKMGAVKHGHLAELEALAVEFEDLLRNVSGLVVVGRQFGEHGAPARLAPGDKVFFELPQVAADGGIGHFENPGDTAVICLDPVSLRPGMTLGKIENIFKICPAPRVNRLRVVADHHNIAVFRAEKIDKIGLHKIGVLIFVDQHMAKLMAVMLADLGVLAQELIGTDEQVVEIHRIGRDFAPLVSPTNGRDGISHAVEVAEAVVHNLLQRLTGVRGERK